CARLGSSSWVFDFW
nr:immunoglobulin heavy chain junction region [Macaca mulatta]